MKTLTKKIEEPKEIFVRELSDQQAKVEILDFVREHPGTDAADVHMELAIDFEQVRRICDELMEEGKIGWADDS